MLNWSSEAVGNYPSYASRNFQGPVEISSVQAAVTAFDTASW